MNKWQQDFQEKVYEINGKESAKFSRDLSKILELNRRLSSVNNREHNELQSEINGLIVDFNYHHSLAVKSGDEELEDILDETLAFLEDARESLGDVQSAMRSAKEIITCLVNERSGIERKDKFASVEDLL